MLHDPEMECTCDGNGCNESVFLPMNWHIRGYDLEDTDAERELEAIHEWTTIDDKHYCTDCREAE